MSDFRYRTLLCVPVASYDMARLATAAQSGIPEDATSEWEEACDGTLAAGVPVLTHRVQDAALRDADMAGLDGLAAQLGGSYAVLVTGRGTDDEATILTRDEGLAELGVSLIRRDEAGQVWLEPEVGA